MNILKSIASKLSTTYEYAYFDFNDNLQARKFNIVQFYARKFFGCYARTHSSRVLRKAYKIVLSNQSIDQLEQQKLLNLIEKTRNFGHIKIAEYQVLDCKDKFTVSFRCKIDTTVPNNYRISDVYWECAVRGRSRSTWGGSIPIGERFVLKLPPNLSTSTTDEAFEICNKAFRDQSYRPTYSRK